MSKTKNDKEQYQKYLSGQMSEQEAHVFERNTLSDAFEQEALEGLEGINSEQAFADIEKLERKVLTRRKGIGWMKIAAVVALFVVSTIAVLLIVRPLKEQQEVAMDTQEIDEKQVGDNDLSEIEKTAVPSPKSSKVDEGIESHSFVKPIIPEEQREDEDLLTIEETEQEHFFQEIPDNNSGVPFDSNEAESDVDPTLSGAELARSSLSEVTEAAEPAALYDVSDMDKEILAAEEVASDDVISSAKSETEPIEDFKVSKRGKPKRKEEAENRSLALTNDSPDQVSGQVVDELGEPLPGVNIIVKGTTNGTITDFDGNYLISTGPSSTLEVSFIGYTSQEIPIDDRRSVDITLNSDVSQLSEVVVTGGEEGRVNSAFTPSKPIVGNKAYKKQIEDNLNYPQSAASNNIEGTVILELTISSSGDISTIEVKKSLGYGCDEEAIRLVREGSAWSPANRDGTNVEDKARVKVRFKR